MCFGSPQDSSATGASVPFLTDLAASFLHGGNSGSRQYLRSLDKSASTAYCQGGPQPETLTPWAHTGPKHGPVPAPLVSRFASWVRGGALHLQAGGKGRTPDHSEGFSWSFGSLEDGFWCASAFGRKRGCPTRSSGSTPVGRRGTQAGVKGLSPSGNLAVFPRHRKGRHTHEGR